MPEELCQVSPKSHYVSLALHSDPSPYINKVWSISEQTLQGWLELEVGYAVVISPKKF